MKSKYLFLPLIGLFMSNNALFASVYDSFDSVSESEAESLPLDRFTLIATEFESRYDKYLAQKEKKRTHAKSDLLTAERKAAIAAIEAEKNRTKKTNDFLENALETPTKTKIPALKAKAAE